MTYPEPKHQATSWRNNNRRPLVAAAVLLVLGSSVIAFSLIHKPSTDTSPLPASLVSQLSYPVYYPDPAKLPAGYQYAGNSANVSEGVLLYELSNQEKKIVVVTHPSPGRNVGLQGVVGFDPFETPLGTAYVGKQKTGPSAILDTGKSMINISGSRDIPQDVINTVVRHLRQID